MTLPIALLSIDGQWSGFFIVILVLSLLCFVAFKRAVDAPPIPTEATFTDVYDYIRLRINKAKTFEDYNKVVSYFNESMQHFMGGRYDEDINYLRDELRMKHQSFIHQNN